MTALDVSPVYNSDTDLRPCFDSKYPIYITKQVQLSQKAGSTLSN